MKIWINTATWISLIMLLSLPAYALKPVDTAIIELYQHIENLQHEVNSLRGTNEQLQKEVDTLRKHQKEGLIDMDDRIQAIETTKKPKYKAIDKSSVSSIKSTKTEKSSPKTATSNSSSKLAYQHAYALLKNDPNAAVRAFERFLKDYASSPLSANAHYWLGETWYSRGKYDQAKKHFLVVLKDHKGSNKESSAALKLGYTFAANKQWDFAKQTLRDVMKFFPNSREAELAEKKLESLKNK
jgi:tol-pal system protein YbgF